MANFTNIITRKGKHNGPTVAIFAGVHGNEKTGVDVLKYLEKHVELHAGCLHLVYANVPALEKNIRFEHKNLNRLFIKGAPIESYEDAIAHELMEILDGCDVLLDLHAYHQPKGISTPFAICEKNAFNVLSGVNIPFTLSGLHNFQKGSTDQYMYFSGKVGICLELGSLQKTEEFVSLGIEASLHMLEFYNLIESTTPRNTSTDTRHLQATQFYIKQSDSFHFRHTYKTFDYIPAGTHMATDGDHNIVVEKDSYILFPNESTHIGTEAYILAEEIR